MWAIFALKNIVVFSIFLSMLSPFFTEDISVFSGYLHINGYLTPVLCNEGGVYTAIRKKTKQKTLQQTHPDESPKGTDYRTSFRFKQLQPYFVYAAIY